MLQKQVSFLHWIKCKQINNHNVQRCPKRSIKVLICHRCQKPVSWLVWPVEIILLLLCEGVISSAELWVTGLCEIRSLMSGVMSVKEVMCTECLLHKDCEDYHPHHVHLITIDEITYILWVSALARSLSWMAASFSSLSWSRSRCANATVSWIFS